MSKKFDFSGIWHGAYEYTSSAKPGTFTSEYDFKIISVGNQIIMQSIPNDYGDYIFLRLTQDDRVLTGTWHEQTSSKGPYRGVAYYGAIQLVISEDGKSMTGKSVGFDRTNHVRSQDWEVARTDKSD